MIKQLMTNPLVLILSGLILGIASKSGDVTNSDNIFFYFGLFSSGLLIWLVVYTALLYSAANKKQAIISILCLMIPMLISYYLYSYYIVEYFSGRVALFWVLILVFSLVITHLVWKIRHRWSFLILFIIGSVSAVLYDAFKINSFQFEVMIPEILISVLALLTIRKNYILK